MRVRTIVIHYFLIKPDYIYKNMTLLFSAGNGWIWVVKMNANYLEGCVVRYLFMKYRANAWRVLASLLN